MDDKRWFSLISIYIIGISTYDLGGDIWVIIIYPLIKVSVAGPLENVQNNVKTTVDTANPQSKSQFKFCIVCIQ